MGDAAFWGFPSRQWPWSSAFSFLLLAVHPQQQEGSSPYLCSASCHTQFWVLYKNAEVGNEETEAQRKEENLPKAVWLQSLYFNLLPFNRFDICLYILNLLPLSPFSVQ